MRLTRTTLRPRAAATATLTNHNIATRPRAPRSLTNSGGALEALLAARGVAVQHAGGDYSGGQCGDTRHGLQCTNASSPSWLAFSGQFDLAHMNFGLHDLADYGPQLPQLPIPQYTANLATIFKRVAAKAKAVMWTSTTPCPDVPTSYGRTYELVVEYNKAAAAALTAAAAPAPLLVNDLFAAFIAHCGDHVRTGGVRACGRSPARPL